jgi:hypothetical protein
MLIGPDPVPVPVGPQEGLLGDVLGAGPAARQAIGQVHDLGVFLQVEVLEGPGKPDGPRPAVPDSGVGGSGGSGCRHHGPFEG